MPRRRRIKTPRSAVSDAALTIHNPDDETTAEARRETRRITQHATVEHQST